MKIIKTYAWGETLEIEIPETTEKIVSQEWSPYSLFIIPAYPDQIRVFNIPTGGKLEISAL